MLLYSGPLSLFSRKIEIALHEKGLPFERVLVPFSQERGYAPKHPAVLAANPKGQVPVLADGDLTLFDSTVIFEYLEDAYPKPPLYPAAAKARANCRMLELFADEILLPDIRRLMHRSERPAEPQRRRRTGGGRSAGRGGPAAPLERAGAPAGRPGLVLRCVLGRRHRPVHGGAVRPATAWARPEQLSSIRRVVRARERARFHRRRGRRSGRSRPDPVPCPRDLVAPLMFARSLRALARSSFTRSAQAWGEFPGSRAGLRSAAQAVRPSRNRSRRKNSFGA